MALIEMGAIVTKIRGKVQGSVFSGNNAGNVIRNKTIPKRSTTDARSAWNNQVKFLSQLWSTLSATDQAAWVTYAANFTFRNKLGADVPAAANLVFQTTNIYAFNITGYYITVPEAFNTPPPLSVTSVTVDMGAGDTKINFTAAIDHLYLTIFASPPFVYGQRAKMMSRIKNIMPVNEINTSDTAAYFGPQFTSKYPYAKPDQYTWIAWRRIEDTCFSWSPLQFKLVQITLS